jgi:hypothetical protein
VSEKREANGAAAAKDTSKDPNRTRDLLMANVPAAGASQNVQTFDRLLKRKPRWKFI